jgi:predicted nucleotidyltransferase
MPGRTHNDKLVVKIDLHDVCKALLDADPDIRDIVLFGSFAYAPSLARDIDLLVTTTNKKDYGVYLDAVADFPLEIDVVVRQPGDKIGDYIAWGVRAVGQVLVGDGRTLEKMMEVPEPTFRNARRLFALADENWESAQREEDSFLKDEMYKDGFSKLFDVARNAVMAYLGSEQTRWGQLRRALPKSFEDRFKQIIDTLHISYFYHGDYPKEQVDEEFKHWRDRVEEFVDDLERATSDSQNPVNIEGNGNAS